MKHIVCYSGGHSSAVVALNVVDRFDSSNVILLNHDIIIILVLTLYSLLTIDNATINYDIIK